MKSKLVIGIVAGEKSGDLLGSTLMRDLKLLRNNIAFIGVGGQQMIAQGLKSEFDIERLQVMGIVEVFKRLPELLYRRYKLCKFIQKIKPDIFIGIDAPDFNLGLEKSLKKSGIKTIHYVSPSIWAWRENRIKTIKSACDLMLTLFPFEIEIYSKYHFPAVYVGHPLLGIINNQYIEQNLAGIRKKLHIDTTKTIIALMPGSRGSEITKLAASFLEVSKKLLQLYPSIHFILPYTDNTRLQQLQKIIQDNDSPHITLTDNAGDALSLCHCVLIASGTATLEAALHEKPMVVAYKVNNFTYRILKYMIHAKFVALPNILANKQIVVELLQDQATVDNMFTEVHKLLVDHECYNQQIIEFKNIKAYMQESQVNAADAVINLLNT